MQYLEATTKRCSLNYAFFKTSEKRYKHITMTSSYEGCKIAVHHMYLKKIIKLNLISFLLIFTGIVSMLLAFKYFITI